MKQKKTLPLSLLLPVTALLLMALTITRLDRRQHAEGKLQLEQALRRTAAACYAAEGAYPPSVAYMQAHYGLRFNESEYTVRYEIFASNLMPDITVLDN